MSRQPTLATARLILRPFRLSDAGDVQRLAGAREVAANTLLIPHPYPDGVAEEWIHTHEEAFSKRSHVNFAITEQEGGALAGAIGLVLKPEHDKAEIGYWVGVPFWSRGYATEAAGALIAYGFEGLSLNRIYASHFTGNLGSGRVMQKVGMRHEGTRRQNYRKWGEYVDCEMYAILRSEAVVGRH